MHKSIVYKLEAISSIEDFAGFVLNEYKAWSNECESILQAGFRPEALLNVLHKFAQLLGKDHGVSQNDDLSRIVERAKSNGNFRKDFFDFYDNFSLPLIKHYTDLIGNEILPSGYHERYTYICSLLDENFENLFSEDNKLIYAFKLGEIERNEAKTYSVILSLEKYSNDKINAAVYNLEQSTISFDKSRQDFIEKSNEYREKIQNNYADDIAALRKAFEADIKVKSAVKYWSDRSVDYLRKARYVIIYLLISLIFIFITLYLIVFKIYDEVIINFLLADQHFKFIAVGAFFTLVVWLIRVFLKLWFSNMHLHNDAAERVIMIQTYIALLADNSLPDKDDRSFVINALFKPVSDGMIKDDGMPNPIIELITKSR